MSAQAPAPPDDEGLSEAATTRRLRAEGGTSRDRRGWAERFPHPVGVKVPAILAVFWIVKILTTAMGEATSDWLGDVNVPLGVVIEVGLMVSALWFQFRSREYHPLRYWYLAGSIAVFGTGVADATHQVGLSYSVTSAEWAIILALVLWRWYRREGTLSIHSITTRRREAYYWATVFATFALGTALGDWSAVVLGIGLLASGIAFGGLILVPLIAWRLGLNSVVAFWAAYILTRPLGASFADYLSKPRSLGGVDFGDGWTAAVFAAGVLAGVIFLVVTGADRQPIAQGA